MKSTITGKMTSELGSEFHLQTIKLILWESVVRGENCKRKFKAGQDWFTLPESR